MRYNQPEMKQVLQNIRSGETIIAEVPVPTPQRGEVLVQTATSLLSAGTERMVVEFAGKSLLGKARSRPDLVRQVIEKNASGRSAYDPGFGPEPSGSAHGFGIFFSRYNRSFR